MDKAFNFESFDIKLETDFIGRNFIYIEEIDSTNRFLSSSNEKYDNGTVVLAEKQTEGKGRKDRVWLSARGLNLTFSILLTEKKIILKNHQLINLASSLCVALSLENLYQLHPELKWPNDILIDNRKICGILIESTSKGSSLEKLIVGVGLNVNQAHFQGDFRIEPTSIKIEVDENVEREKVLAEYLNCFEEVLSKIKSNPSWITSEWRERCRMIGKRIAVTEDDKIRYGIFTDISEDGFLLLRNGSKVEEIHFGDISVT
ncbi:MAG: biotin--[acetyl-CoA-carboxylase] ligase [Ignavibacteriaceae bacterium]|nr:biotin--[acetyl-CoA-carboxylase] ligase [Ignavibacteriaceae bacterium]